MPTLKLWVNGLEDERRVADRLRALDGVFAAALNDADQCAEVGLRGRPRLHRPNTRRDARRRLRLGGRRLTVDSA